MANKKNGLLSKVPLPDTFFSIKHQLRPIAPLRLSAPSAAVIYLLTIGGFVGCWIFYSLPNPPQTLTVIQSEWQKDGYECKPLQKDPHYGLMHTYDECKTKLLPASAATLSLDNATQRWAYKPFADSDAEALYPNLPSTMADVFTEIKTPAQLSDGSCFEGSVTAKMLQLNFQTPSTTEKVTQTNWYKEGYECKPLQKDSRYNSFFSYDECLKINMEPNNNTVAGTGSGKGYQILFYPFGTKGQDFGYNNKNPYDKPLSSVNDCFRQEFEVATQGIADQRYDGFRFMMDSTKIINGAPILALVNKTFYQRALKKCLSSTSTELNPSICRHLKDNSPFECTKTYGAAGCVSKERAKKIFNALNDKYPICDRFKTNAPFQCTKTEITYKSKLEILSLSIANTQLLFGVLTAFCAYIFYKLKKKDEVSPVGRPVVSPVGEAGWQETIEQLRKEFQQALTKKADKTEKETV